SVHDALEDYFKYSAIYAEKASYSEIAWSNLLKNDIDNERPIVYSGSSSGGGHAWNCDGYMGSDFHMNWGWDGAYNGYYSLDNLTAGGLSFDSDFAIVYTIIPLSGYPTYCTGTKIINGHEGSFNDGSGNQNYQNNINCFYQISPVCGNVVEVDWDVFQLESNDLVKIYDGTSTSDPLLATFTGDSVPETVTTLNGALLLQFTTNASGNDIGWYASYKTEFCSTTALYTAPSGSFTDGSGTCDYESGTYCKWDIYPPGATSVTISFPQFNLSTNESFDYVKIYKDNTNAANLLYTFTNANLPSGSYFVPSGHAVVRFVTNSTEQSQGWTINYTSSTTSTEENEVDIYEYEVFPNPFSTDATIKYSLYSNSEITMRLTNVLGETLSELKKFQNVGSYELQLSDIYQNIDNGIYFISMQSQNKTITKRIVCTK
ncbi:MAG: CUB domain-containing protein, partial [Bacteroidota bacterium]